MIAINTHKYPFYLRVIVTLVMLVVFSLQHPTSTLLAQGGDPACDTDVSFQYYDVAPDGSWVASGEWGQANTCIDPGAICPPGTGLIRVRPSSGAEFWHCGGGGLPDPPPNYPGINAGQACLAGSSRTVTITPTGDSHELQISPGNQIIALAGNSHTFTNLQQDIDYRFRAQAENSGGSSGWSSWTGIVRHDLTAPTTTLDLVGTSGSNNWWQSAVSVTLPATDSGCLGVSDTFYTLDSLASTYSGAAFEVSGDGTHDLSYYSTDGSYDEVSQSTTISIDTVVPILSLITDRASDSSNGWWTAPVIITVVGDDVTSGVDTLDTNHNSAGWTAYSAPITLSTDGTHNLDARVIDVAGWETVDGIVIPIDTSAPTLFFTFDREPDRNGWYNDSVSVGVESADATSGVSGTVARLVYEGTWRNYTGAYLIGGDGEHLFEAIVTDIAGNTNARRVTVPIDVTPPTTTLTWDGETLDISATDNRSGVMGTTLTINGVVTPYTGEAIEFEIVGDYRIEVYSTDMAGNDEAVQVLNITYDPTAPSATTSTSLSTPTLEAELSCSDDRYDVTGFASATSGLSAVYLLAQSESGDAFEVAGSRYSYNPASTEVEAFSFYYTPDDELDDSLTVVAEDVSGGERRLGLGCPSDELLLAPTSTEATTPTTDYLNQYPASLGDMSSDLETPTQPSVETEDSSGTQANANTPITSNYVAPDTRVTVIEPTPPELTIVEGNPSPLSAQELATILSMTGLLATTTAAVGLQVTETARRRREELEAERLEAEQQRQADLDAQAQRARENADMNAQMRLDAQREVILEVQQSEANKQYHEYVAALWAEYYARLDAAQQYQMQQATAAAYTLPEGSTIADLPQDIQDIYWELGNMSLEYANHVEKDANGNVIHDANGNPITWTTHDADGKWAFNKKERGDLGYYQYLIREAAKAGDLQAVLDYTSKGGEYIGKTLASRVDRELSYVRETQLDRAIQRQANAVSTAPTGLAEFEDYNVSNTERMNRLVGITDTEIDYIGQKLDDRGVELHIEFNHRAGTGETLQKLVLPVVELIDPITHMHKADAEVRLLAHMELIAPMLPRSVSTATSAVEPPEPPEPPTENTPVTESQSSEDPLIYADPADLLYASELQSIEALMALANSEHPYTAWQANTSLLQTYFGIELTEQGFDVKSDKAWTLDHLKAVRESAGLTDAALLSSDAWPIVEVFGVEINSAGQAFQNSMGSIEIRLHNDANDSSKIEEGVETYFIADEDRSLILLGNSYQGQLNENGIPEGLVNGLVREYGLIFDRRANSTPSMNLAATPIPANPDQTNGSSYPLAYSYIEPQEFLSRWYNNNVHERLGGNFAGWESTDAGLPDLSSIGGPVADASLRQGPADEFAQQFAHWVFMENWQETRIEQGLSATPIDLYAELYGDDWSLVYPANYEAELARTTPTAGHPLPYAWSTVLEMTHDPERDGELDYSDLQEDELSDLISERFTFHEDIDAGRYGLQAHERSMMKSNFDDITTLHSRLASVEQQVSLGIVTSVMWRDPEFQEQIRAEIDAVNQALQQAELWQISGRNNLWSPPNYDAVPLTSYLDSNTQVPNEHPDVNSFAHDIEQYQRLIGLDLEAMSPTDLNNLYSTQRDLLLRTLLSNPETATDSNPMNWEWHQNIGGLLKWRTNVEADSVSDGEVDRQFQLALHNLSNRELASYIGVSSNPETEEEQARLETWLNNYATDDGIDNLVGVPDINMQPLGDYEDLITRQHRPWQVDLLLTAAQVGLSVASGGAGGLGTGLGRLLAASAFAVDLVDASSAIDSGDILSAVIILALSDFGDAGTIASKYGDDAMTILRNGLEGTNTELAQELAQEIISDKRAPLDIVRSQLDEIMGNNTDDVAENFTDDVVQAGEDTLEEIGEELTEQASETLARNTPQPPTRNIEAPRVNEQVTEFLGIANPRNFDEAVEELIVQSRRVSSEALEEVTSLTDDVLEDVQHHVDEVIDDVQSQIDSLGTGASSLRQLPEGKRIPPDDTLFTQRPARDARKENLLSRISQTHNLTQAEGAFLREFKPTVLDDISEEHLDQLIQAIRDTDYNKIFAVMENYPDWAGSLSSIDDFRHGTIQLNVLPGHQLMDQSNLTKQMGVEPYNWTNNGSCLVTNMANFLGFTRNGQVVDLAGLHEFAKAVDFNFGGTGGTSISLVEGYLDEINLPGLIRLDRYTLESYLPDKIVEAVSHLGDTNKIVLASMETSTIPSDISGHSLVVYGMVEDGYVVVGDPDGAFVRQIPWETFGESLRGVHVITDRKTW